MSSESRAHELADAIDGMGPRTADALVRAGLGTFDLIADSSPVALERALKSQGVMMPASRIEHSKWIEQARKLAEVEVEGFAPRAEFSVVVGTLEGGDGAHRLRVRVTRQGTPPESTELEPHELMAWLVDHTPTPVREGLHPDLPLMSRAGGGRLAATRLQASVDAEAARMQLELELALGEPTTTAPWSLIVTERNDEGAIVWSDAVGGRDLPGRMTAIAPVPPPGHYSFDAVLVVDLPDDVHVLHRRMELDAVPVVHRG